MNKLIFPLIAVIGASVLLVSSLGNVWNAKVAVDEANRDVEQSKAELEQSIIDAEEGAKECIASEGYDNCIVVCNGREQVLRLQCLEIMDRANAEMSAQ